MNHPNRVVEVSWEVVNKVGGIHTVVRTKANLLTKRYENYLLIGPLFPGRLDVEFQQETPPQDVQHAVEVLNRQGVRAAYGTWLIRGRPKVLLIDASSSNLDLAATKAFLWERYQVDSLHAGYDFDEPLQWAWAAAVAIEALQESAKEPLVAHFHEWMAGLGLLYLHSKGARTATVFTTHATMLGRTISGATSIHLYDELDHIDADPLARELRVSEKHTTEKACAAHADVFTTVSDITALETERLLGKTPDVILYNGVELAKYPTTEEASVLHRHSRERLRDFMDYYFFSHHRFDLDKALFFFTSGRYEYSNKGLDVLTEALGRLNEHLKGSERTIVVFYFVPGDARGVKPELLEKRAAFERLQQYLADQTQHLARTLAHSVGDLEELQVASLIPEEARIRLARMAERLRHDGNPPLCTHEMPGEEHDAIIAGFRRCGLLNKPEDRVKVVSYPVYLTGADGLLDLSYSEAVAGCHLGLFPSAYEPWGYTPVECAALTVPTVTSDLAGFGRYIEPHLNHGGVHVLKRHQRSREQIVADLYGIMASFSELDKYGRMEEKLAAKEAVNHTGWETFIKRYFQAHERAYNSKL
jgi:glycogen synthase